MCVCIYIVLYYVCKYIDRFIESCFLAILLLAFIFVCLPGKYYKIDTGKIKLASYSYVGIYYNSYGCSFNYSF